MKKIVKMIVLCCCVIGVSACSESAVQEYKLENGNNETKFERLNVPTTSPKSVVSSSVSWAFPFVIWGYGQTYIISEASVEEDEVGDEIGQVKRDVEDLDHITVKNGFVEHPYVSKDRDSNMPAVGSKIFALKGADVKNTI